MRAIVLGSAAGGGFPQWNCACGGCSAVRSGSPGFVARTQDSVAVTANGEQFALLNASPDILVQIKATQALWPRAPRHTPIGAVVVTNGDMDHILGLFSLRESQPFSLYATRSVWEGLRTSALFRTLERFDGQVVLRHLELDQPIELLDPAGGSLGLRVTPFAAAGKLPVHMMGHASPNIEDNIGLRVAQSQPANSPTLAYVSACASVEGLDLRGDAAVLFDGTFFRDNELATQHLSSARANEMAHLPIGGESGSLAALRSLRGRRIYTHINNSNPILGPSLERYKVEDAGWEIAYDGMEINI